MLKNKICPYCNGNLELSMVSSPSLLLGKDSKYIGCSNCGEVSLLYKDSKVIPLTSVSRKEENNFVKRDINDAFSRLKTENVTDNLKDAIKKMDKRAVIFGNQEYTNNIEKNKPLVLPRKEIKEDDFFKSPYKADRQTQPMHVKKSKYLVIDEDKMPCVFEDVTKEELVKILEKDNHKGKNYDDYEIYELKNPLKVKKVITIE